MNWLAKVCKDKESSDYVVEWVSDGLLASMVACGMSRGCLQVVHPVAPELLNLGIGDQDTTE